VSAPLSAQDVVLGVLAEGPQTMSDVVHRTGLTSREVDRVLRWTIGEEVTVLDGGLWTLKSDDTRTPIEAAVYEHLIQPALIPFEVDRYPTTYAFQAVRLHSQVIAIPGDPTSWHPIADSNLTEEEVRGRIVRYADATDQDVHDVVRALADGWVEARHIDGNDEAREAAFAAYMDCVEAWTVTDEELPLYNLIEQSEDGLASLDPAEIAAAIGVDTETYFRLSQSLQNKGRIDYYAPRGYYVTVPRGLVR
jgi:hypothetical protein